MKRQRRLRELAKRRKEPVVINIVYRDMRNPLWDQPAPVDPPKAKPKEITPVGDAQKTMQAREHPQVCPSCGRGGL
jgi:hypothetical protein